MVFLQVILSFSLLFAENAVTDQFIRHVLDGIRQDPIKEAKARELFADLTHLTPSKSIINFLSILEADKEDTISKNLALFTAPRMIEFSIRVISLLDGDQSLVEFMEFFQKQYEIKNLTFMNIAI
jgi:hypothetical protein